MKKTSEGILYPLDAENEITIEKKADTPLEKTIVRTIPHKAWSLCKDTLDSVFSSISQYDVRHFILLSPLHAGSPVSDFEASYSVYTYEEDKGKYKSACIVADDDICSEEFSLEIILPYLNKLFPHSEYHAFFAPAPETKEDEESLKEVLKELDELYRSAVILISDNDGCCSMWLNALESMHF